MAQAVQLLYNIVDRIYIGHLPGIGQIALTGLGVTFPVTVLIAAFIQLVGVGGTPLFSMARGRQDETEAEAIMGNCFALLMLASIGCFLVGYFFTKPILFAFGASEESFFYADQYLKIYLFGTLFSMLATGLNGYINAQGFPRIGMLTTLLGAVLNIVLDPLFIFLFDMGVQGAALATVISQGISCIWVLRFLTGNRAILRLKKKISKSTRKEQKGSFHLVFLALSCREPTALYRLSAIISCRSTEACSLSAEGICMWA